MHQLFRDNHFAICTYIKSVCCISKTNTVFYIDYISEKKKKRGTSLVVWGFSAFTAAAHWMPQPKKGQQLLTRCLKACSARLSSWLRRVLSTPNSAPIFPSLCVHKMIAPGVVCVFQAGRPGDRAEDPLPWSFTGRGQLSRREARFVPHGHHCLYGRLEVCVCFLFTFSASIGKESVEKRIAGDMEPSYSNCPEV